MCVHHHSGVSSQGAHSPCHGLISYDCLPCLAGSYTPLRLGWMDVCVCICVEHVCDSEDLAGSSYSIFSPPIDLLAE
jgi:hypothetical protein